MSHVWTEVTCADHFCDNCALDIEGECWGDEPIDDCMNNKTCHWEPKEQEATDEPNA